MAKSHDPENERLKHKYRTYKREAGQHSEASLDAIAKALHRFESYTRFQSFKTFNPQQAIGFKRHLAGQRNGRTGDALSVATQYSTLAALKAFFIWLRDQPGFKSRLTYGDAEYFNMSRGETRIAKTRREPRVPSLEQVHAVIARMPDGTSIERRDRALIAFILLTGARDGAVASLKLRHVETAANRVVFDAHEVRTKFSKSFATWFFPVGGDARQIVIEWVERQLGEALYSPGDPLFPATRIEPGPDRRFRPVGLTRAHWSNATPIRAIFKRAFLKAGLPYFPPHSLRKTLMQLAYRLRLPPEELKAWSQNLGHEGVLTTLTSYGEVSAGRQAEIILGLATARQESPEVTDLLRRAAAEMARNGTGGPA
ncbi:MAG: tyrosine-type recombinase/integrase [Reyranellaceae bacterium]